MKNPLEFHCDSVFLFYRVDHNEEQWLKPGLKKCKYQFRSWKQAEHVKIVISEIGYPAYISRFGRGSRCSLPTNVWFAVKAENCSHNSLHVVLVSLSDACELTLDTNTANRNLTLSDNNRKVNISSQKQLYPDHPDRFDYCSQLLCETGLTGRCYWEVEWSEKVYISVTYRAIRRKGADGPDSRFGGNKQSWSLRCSDGDGFSVWHNNRQTRFPSSSSTSHRVAVYLDCPGGSLSFYSVSSDKLIHIHTYSTTFTEPLYPGFRLWADASVSLCTMEWGILLEEKD